MAAAMEMCAATVARAQAAGGLSEGAQTTLLALSIASGATLLSFARKFLAFGVSRDDVMELIATLGYNLNNQAHLFGLSDADTSSMTERLLTDVHNAPEPKP